MFIVLYNQHLRTINTIKKNGKENYRFEISILKSCMIIEKKFESDFFNTYCLETGSNSCVKIKEKIEIIE